MKKTAYDQVKKQLMGLMALMFGLGMISVLGFLDVIPPVAWWMSGSAIVGYSCMLIAEIWERLSQHEL